MATEEEAKWRKNIRLGMRVEVVLKKDQATGKRTEGIVRWVLTSREFHSYGIKVILDNRKIGRVQKVIELPPWETGKED
jgi:uncharacterized repeat protein (TIGR03833 family)